ncbi:MAG: site-2 protease family protein [Planctomycetes bacterium]|nr:site-2 protease family protein [Planctomycetota bacterium]
MGTPGGAALEYAIGLTVVILLSAFGLGFVIFVHELGHFLVAKLCGVKCEKFYLGFDIAGLKFCKFRWGETEYGIGILPLGGYVKMLGQEDNPARIREEMERAKQGAEGGGLAASAASEERSEVGDQRSEVGDQRSEVGDQRSEVGDQRSEVGKAESPNPEPSSYDPRSFLAQSVPKRMAIISAGVIMNLIFAFLMAVAAFWIGVEQTPCVIGTVLSGEAAWQADLRPGDVILEIAGKKMHQFRDLNTAIQLGDINVGDSVPLLVRRPGVEKPFTVKVKPDRSRGAFFIGVTGGYTTRLLENRKTWLVQKRRPVLPGSAADRAEPALCNGDKIVQIDDTPIDNFAQIAVELARKVDVPIKVTVQRAVVGTNGKPTGKTERVTTVVPPNPMWDLGLVMKLGNVAAVQADSPAAGAGIVPGDKIQDPAGDPMLLPDWLRRRAGETVDLTVQRKGAEEQIAVPVRLRRPMDYSPPASNSPVSSSALGIAYLVLNRVDRVIEGSPAAKAGLRPGDLITYAELLPPDDETLEKLKLEGQATEEVEFDEKKRNWPWLISLLQQLAPGTKVKLTFLRQGDEKTVDLTPVESEDWFNQERGFRFELMSFDRKAESLGDAFALGGQETLDSLTIVFRSVKAISTNRVSPRGLAGPVTIVKIILLKADEGTAKLLLFLTLLSANLAVINFLPIPVLDGGHFVLLCYEGIRGKPANEHVQTVLAYIGMALILALMAWVLGLDFGLISRQG